MDYIKRPIDIKNMCGDEELSDYYVDMENREIYINGTIDEGVVINCIKPITDICHEDINNKVPIEERRPIAIYISSNGGDITSGLSLCDTIMMSSTPIVGIGIGAIYSMAFVILTCCHYRLSYPHASFLFHDGYLGCQATTSKFFDYVKHIQRREKEVKELILNNTNISKSLLNRKYHTDWFMTPQEALKLGVIDEILDYDAYKTFEKELEDENNKETAEEENKEV
jgi:ATP-dependent Clp protease protease subunit